MLDTPNNYFDIISIMKIPKIWPFFIILTHSGIARRYENTELLGTLFHYFDLIILTPSHFTRPTTDTIFCIMRYS